MTPAPPAEYRNRNALFGYIDRSGRFVIPPQFSSASPFSEKLAAVCCGNDNRGSARYGYIDQRGHYVVPPRFTRTCPFSEGLACASVETGMLAPQGYIDKAGKFIIQPRFQFARNFANGLASTLDGYIDRAGQVIIPAQSVVESGDFAEGLARTSQNNKEVFVDTAGKVKLQPGYEGVGDFSEGLAPACKSDCNMSGGDGSWGFMDKTGKFVIPARFGYKPSSFHDGLALVCFGCTG